ncbi:MAG: methyltransferase domain-containing protein [Magnetococcales bacterium]|nr:methyltransferase domain-containing protein [Magnetococcales bacterium]
MSGDDGYLGDELAALSLAMNYYRWVAEAFRPWVHGDGVEIGAGIGTFAALLQDRLATLELVEPSTHLIPPLTARFAHAPQVRILHTDLEGYLQQRPAASLDAIILVNVLEHVEQDEAMVRALVQTLRPGGSLLLFVPALPWLYNGVDRRYGHHRRYVKKALVALAEESGLIVRQCRYVDLMGVLPWWLMRFRGDGPIFMPGMVRLYDRWFIPLTRWIEGFFSPPLGKSLLLIATRPDAGA